MSDKSRALSRHLSLITHHFFRRKIMKRLLTLAILSALAGASAGAQTRRGGGQPRTPAEPAAPAAPAAARDTLIRNATVLTVSHGTLTGADVLIRNGKISAVGPNLKAPDGARVIDATGKFVLPGIIDAHSHSMMDGSVNECTRSVTSMVTTRDILNPSAVNIYRELAGGTTAALLLHGSCNSIGGLSTTVKFKWGHPAADFPVPGAPPGIKFALGENPKRSNFSLPGVPARYRAANARGEKNLIPPRRDLELEPLVEILEGKRYVHSHCYRADEILMLINLADEFGFKVRTFQHVLEGYKVAAEIAA